MHRIEYILQCPTGNLSVSPPSSFQKDTCHCSSQLLCNRSSAARASPHCTARFQPRSTAFARHTYRMPPAARVPGSKRPGSPVSGCADLVHGVTCCGERHARRRQALGHLHLHLGLHAHAGPTPHHHHCLHITRGHMHSRSRVRGRAASTRAATWALA